jgi:hypothetical protein
MGLQGQSNQTIRARDGAASVLECRLLRVHRAASLLLTSLQRAGTDTYRVNPGDVLFLRQAVEAASEDVRREVSR